MDVIMNVPKVDNHQRVDFSVDQKAALLNAWEKGMKSTKNKDAIQELVIQVGYLNIKNWIGNHNKRKDEKKGYSKKKLYKRGPSGYSLFASTMKKGEQDKEFFEQVSSDWKRLSEHEREEYNNKARECREDPMYGGGSLPKLLEKSRMQSEPEESYKHKTDVLRKKLREHLKKTWAKSTGLISNIPYTKIANGTLSISICGLPEGVIFKKPSAYGYKTIVKLLNSELSFQIISKNNMSESIPDISNQQLTNTAVNNDSNQESSPIGLTNSDGDGSQSDIDRLIKQIKKRSKVDTPDVLTRKRQKKTEQVQSKSKADSRKWYKVEKVIKKKGSRVHIKWADGSSSWEPSTSLTTEDVDVEDAL